MGRSARSRQRSHGVLLFAAQGGRCAICGLHMVNGFFGPPRKHLRDRRATIEHVVPRARGGLNVLANKLLTHSACNAAKGASKPSGCELLMRDLVHARIGWALA